MLETVKEMFEETFPEGEEEENEEALEEEIPYKRFGYSKALPIHQDDFDVLELYDSKDIIKKFKFSNKNGLVVEVMNFGATIINIRMPDKFGNSDDVLLGFDTVQEYYDNKCKIGGMVGRTSNIIEDANFKIGSELHFLSKNAGLHHKDGGVVGFDKVIWKSYVEKPTNSLILTHLSEHHEEGYPGNLLIRICMKLSDENEFIVSINAVCDETTAVDIAPKLFFNLTGHGTGDKSMKTHKMLINADMFVKQDSKGVATGKLKHVNKTYFDLRTPKPFYYALDRIRGGGYSHTFCLNKSHRDATGLIFAGRLEESELGRYIEIWTDASGLYFYTANQFPDKDTAEEELEEEDVAIAGEEPGLSQTSEPKPVSQRGQSFMGRLKGKNDFFYTRHGAVAFSAQEYPNSVNIPSFPSCIIHPHKAFKRKIIYKFGVSNKILTHPKVLKDMEASRRTVNRSGGIEEENKYLE